MILLFYVFQHVEKTFLQARFKRVQIALEHIAGGAESEIFHGELIASASLHGPLDEFAKIAFKRGPVVFEVAADPGLENAEGEFNGTVVGRVGGQGFQQASFFFDGELNPRIHVPRVMIEDDDASRGGIRLTLRQKIVDDPLQKLVGAVFAFSDTGARQIAIECVGG